MSLNRTWYVLLLGLFCVLLTHDASAQDQKTRFVLKLDSDLVSSFKSYGSLRSAVPDAHKNKISFVEIQFSGAGNDPVELDLGLQINGDNANIVLTDAVIERIQKHPVRLAVADDASSFSQIVLMYEAGNTAPAPPQLNDGGSPTNQYYIGLTNRGSMSGMINGFDTFQLTTRFGKVSMPMDQVIGIKFHVDSKDSCIVVLNNGDVITGVPEIKAIELKTDWGQADIEPKFIDALTTAPTAKFTQATTEFGLRWVLKPGTEVASGSSDVLQN